MSSLWHDFFASELERQILLLSPQILAPGRIKARFLNAQHLSMKKEDLSTPIPKQYCWKCGYQFTATSPAVGEYKPSAGDISMCISCGVASVFNEDLTLRKPTPEELEIILRHPVLTAAQIYRADVVGDKLKGRK